MAPAKPIGRKTVAATATVEEPVQHTAVGSPGWSGCSWDAKRVLGRQSSAKNPGIKRCFSRNGLIRQVLGGGRGRWWKFGRGGGGGGVCTFSTTHEKQSKAHCSGLNCEAEGKGQFVRRPHPCTPGKEEKKQGLRWIAPPDNAHKTHRLAD